MSFLINPFMFAAGGSFTDPDDIASLQVGYESDYGLFSDAAGTSAQSSNGGTVRCWKPKYGSLTDFLTRSGGNGPTLDTGTTLNSLQTIQFAAASTQDMDFPNIVGALTEGEMMMVVKMAADPSVGTAYGFIYMGRANFNSHYPFTDSNVYDGYGSNSRRSTGNPSQNLAAWHVYNPLSSSGEWTLRINNATHYTDNASGTSVAFPDYTPFPGGIGRSFSSGGPNYADMHVAAIYHFSAKLNSTDRGNMYTYINGKYGV
jgi:hypothetical protein